MFGGFLDLEHSGEKYLPYGQHTRRNILPLSDGSRLAMARLHGMPHELSSARERNGAARMLNGLYRGLEDETISLWTHFVRSEVGPSTSSGVPEMPRFRNAFSRALYEAFVERVLQGALYDNSWYISLVVAPRSVIGGGSLSRDIRTLWSTLRRRSGWRKRPEEDEDLEPRLERAWEVIAQAFKDHDLVRLGMREENGFLYSEIGEALYRIFYCREHPVGVVNGSLGGAIFKERPIFHPLPRYSFELRGPWGRKFGMTFGFKRYMAHTRPNTMDAIYALPMPLVLAQSYSLMARDKGLSSLDLRARQGHMSQDYALTQLAKIDEKGGALDLLQGDAFVVGSHHLSLTIFANSLAELQVRASLAYDALARTQATVVAESNPGGLVASFFAQMPGVFDYRTRPAGLASWNFAHLSSFASYPRGASSGHWGRAMVRLPTTAKTGFDLVPHMKDVGMWAIFGMTGSCKSTLLMFFTALFDQYMVDPSTSAQGPGLIFVFDKDRRGEITITAMGGNYLAIRAGTDSGLAPFKGFDDTPYARAVLERWIRLLIELDERGPIPTEDDERLARGVAAVLRLPVEERSLLALRKFLGWQNPNGAGPRLQPWCRGEARGWAFDGEKDELSFDACANGADLTDILEFSEIVLPATQYMRDRIRPLMDGRRIAILMDEAPQYTLHAAVEQYVKSWLQTARGNNALIWLVAQQPEDMTEGAFGATLINQCHTWLFAAPRAADPAVYKGKLKFTAGEWRVLTEELKSGSHRWLLKRHGEGPDVLVILDLDLSKLPEFVAVLSGRASTVRFAAEIRAKHANDDDPNAWWREYMVRFREVND
jgi:type IV secretion system protein VirB4